MTSEIYLTGGGMGQSFSKIYLHSSASTGNLPHFEAKTTSGGELRVRPNDMEVTETFELWAQGTPATLRLWSRALSDMLRRALAYKGDRFNPSPVWYVENIEGEGLKYSLVTDYAFDVVNEGLANRGFTHGIGRWNLVITRRMGFERPRTDSFELMIVKDKEDVSASAGKWYTKPDFDYPGDLDGRIEQISFKYGVNQLATVYAGFRPIRDETWTYGDFVGWIECEGGIAGNGTAAGADPDKTASGTGAMITNFATAPTKTIIGRMALKASDFAADSDIYVGSYKVLVRGRLDTPGSEIGLRMLIRYGSNANSPHISSSYVTYKYNHADYTLIEMGEMTLPPHPFKRNAADKGLGDFYIVFQAEKITLEPKFYWDAVAIIPAEHFVKIELPDPANAPNTSSTYVYTDEDGAQWSAVIDDGDIVQQPTVNAKNWVYPRRQGLLVVAALEGTNRVHSLGRTMDIEMRINPRFQAHWEDEPEPEGGGDEPEEGG